MGDFLWNRKPNSSEWMNVNASFPNSRPGMTEEEEVDRCTRVKHNRGREHHFQRRPSSSWKIPSQTALRMRLTKEGHVGSDRISPAIRSAWRRAWLRNSPFSGNPPGCVVSKKPTYLIETPISAATDQDIDLNSTVETSSPEVPAIAIHIAMYNSQIHFFPLVSKPVISIASPVRGETGKHCLTLTHMRIWQLLTNKTTNEGRIQSQFLSMGVKLGHKSCCPLKDEAWLAAVIHVPLTFSIWEVKSRMTSS